MDQTAFNSPSELFQALADQTRVRIMRLFASMPAEKACLCEFSESLEEPDYNVSRHLKILRHAGILRSSKEGRWVYHKLANDSKAIHQLCEFLTAFPDHERSFEHDLLRFKEQIEKREHGKCSRR